MNLIRLITNYKYRKQLDLHEIHTYVQDIKEVTFLRDKCKDDDERKDYDTILKSMRLILQFLTRERGQ